MTDPATGPVPDPVAQAADRLYAVPPHQFVAERTAAVAQARAAGDPATAAAIGKLRRPTVAAWLVNLLALRRPDLMTTLTELAAALYAAQQDLDGAQLRELTTQRRATVAALVATARSLAHDADPAATDGKLPLAEVETTLGAALSDTGVAEQVRSGRLTRAVSRAPAGELPRPEPGTRSGARLRLVPDQGPDTTAGPASAEPVSAEPDPGRQQELQAELAAARAEAAAAGAELDRATAAQRDATQALADLDAALVDLSARRAAAAQELAQAEAAGLAARRAVKAAKRRVGQAEAAAGHWPE